MNVLEFVTPFSMEADCSLNFKKEREKEDVLQKARMPPPESKKIKNNFTKKQTKK